MKENFEKIAELENLINETETKNHYLEEENNLFINSRGFQLNDISIIRKGGESLNNFVLLNESKPYFSSQQQSNDEY